MPAGSRKSKTLRKVFVRTPGSKTVKLYLKRKPSAAKCGGCDRVLKGVPRERPAKLQKIPKSSRRPERPYGGVLCSACSRKKIIKQTRE